MTHHDEHSLAETPQAPPAFLRRLAEFENAVELSEALANQAEVLERRFLGHREDGQNTGGPAHVPTSFNDALEVHAINLKITLERISDSLGRLDDESNGIPLNHEDDPFIADRERARAEARADDPYLKPRTYGTVPK